MELGLAHSRVLVTGSSRGIGYGIASCFLEEGATVVLTARDGGRLTTAGTELGQKFGTSNVETYQGDLGDPGVRQSLKVAIQAKGLDHLVCNAGSGRSVPALQEKAADWQQMLDVNLLGAAGMVRDVLSLLTESAGRGRAPTVTFVGSICGIEAIGCPLTYASAKAALWAYAKNLVKPLAELGIRVNMVSPGNVRFPGSVWDSKIAHDPSAVESMLNSEVPLRRLASLDEIAAAVVFLSSKKASFITGANLVVDGGQTKGL
jgi:3-oxoacyl-[acyl-carrier protein] reductase